MARPKEHGMHGTPIYMSWCDMKSRCYNVKHTHYHLYGGIGIKVCDSWKKKFINFYRDMGDKPKDDVLNRLNKFKDFSPENCVWSDKEDSFNFTRMGKLTEDEVREIKELYKTEKDMKKIASKYNVHQETIRRVIKKKSYKWVK